MSAITAGSWQITAHTDQPVHGRNTRSHSSSAAANTR